MCSLLDSCTVLARGSALLMGKRKDLGLNKAADAATPQTPSTASDDSDTCDREEDVLYIEITLRRAISGQQLGHPKVLDMSRLRNRLMSLGSLMAMGI